MLGSETGTLTLQSTVGELADAWISHLDPSRADLTQTTKDTYSREARTLVVPTLGDIKLGQLTTLVIQEHIDILAKKKTPASSRRMQKNLHMMCLWATRLGVLAADPTAATTNPNKKRCYVPKAPSRKQVDTLRSLLRRDYRGVGRTFGPRPASAYLAVEIAAGTGARIGEIAALRWKDIDLEESRITFSDTQVTENGAPALRGHLKNRDPHRTVFIPSWPADLLAEFESRPNGYVIRNRDGESIIPNNLRREMRTVYENADITEGEQITVHEIRAYIGTKLAREVGNEACADQLGDTIETVRKHYVERAYTGPRIAADVLQGELTAPHKK